MPVQEIRAYRIEKRENYFACRHTDVKKFKKDNISRKHY